MKRQSATKRQAIVTFAVGLLAGVAGSADAAPGSDDYAPCADNGQNCTDDRCER